MHATVKDTVKSLRKITKKVVGNILLLALLFSFIVLPLPLCVLKVNAYTGTNLYANPATKFIGVGETYTFDIMLENASNVIIIGFSLSFDTSKVNVTDILIGDALPSGALLIGDWDSVAGVIKDISVGVLGGVSYDVDDKTVVTITVEAHDITGSSGTVVDIYNMSCWDKFLFEFLSGDSPYDHTVTISPPIKVGVLGPMAWMQGLGMVEGAEIARDEINAGDGILGTSVELVYADTLRGHEYPNGVTGAEAANELINAGCDFVIGGYWSDTVAAAQEAFMDYETIFLITGAFEDELMEGVSENYARYKYLFRVAPTNFSMQAVALGEFVHFVLESKLSILFGGDEVPDEQVRVAVLSENLTIWDDMHYILTNPAVYPYVLGPFANVTYSARVSANETDFSTELQGINGSRARILIHLFSTQAGVNFTRQWKESGIEAIPVGINLYSQRSEFWEETEEKCKYETILATSGTRTPLSTKALALYDKIISLYGHAPIYTAFGAYDAIYTIKEAVERAETVDSDAVVAELEQTDRVSTLGKFKFTEAHDVFCSEIGGNWTDGYIRPLIAQWQRCYLTGEGRLEVVYPIHGRAASFARKWRIPTWIYSLAETDLQFDGEIDIFDMIRVASRHETKAGDPDWNIEADIDGNGIVNVADISRVAKDFGKNVSSSSMGKSTETILSNPIITGLDSTALVYLDSPTINGTEIGVGNYITVNLNISDAVEVYSWQAGITFNATLLECTNFVSGNFLQQDVPGALVLWKSGQRNNTLGIVTPHAETFEGDFNKSGSGTLARITFKVTALGVSDLHLRDTMVFDYWGVENFSMVPFNIFDTYTVTRSAAQTIFAVSNSTGVYPGGYMFDDDGPILIVIGSGFYNHTFSHVDELLHFNVTGPYPGFSNVTIPKTLLNISTQDKLLVIIDDEPLYPEERIVTENPTHYFVYFNYTSGIHSIHILERPPVYNIDKNKYYETIQEAINSAQQEERILAFEQTHYGNVVVNTTVSLIGENVNTTVIDGNGIGTVIEVTANNVSITGFTIRNSGNPESGIIVDGSSGSNISHNIITNNYYGIHLVDSVNITLDGNDISTNEYGILVERSSQANLTGNIMWDNKYNFGLNGMVETHFDNDIDESNTVDGKPIRYVKQASNTVYDSFSNAGTVYLINCDNITVANLALTKNVYAIFLWNTTNSKIQNVTTSNNKYGIYLQGESNYNDFTDNFVSNNTFGIYLNSSNNSAIYHNSFINNTWQANTTNSYNNAWDNNYPSGGNYWSHYINWDYFKGVYQNETNNDGILDQNYVIDMNNMDRYPLISPLTPPVFNLDTFQAYTKIQDAIDALLTSSGDTIVVRAGTYYEHVTIDKSLTLIGIIRNTIIDGSGSGNVVTITADNVVLRGFIIQGSGSTGKGILLSNANYTIITRNTINNTDTGIHFESSNCATVSRNTITNNSYGIVFIGSSFNDVHRNNLTYNDYGIYLFQSSNNTFYHNNFIDNTQQIASPIYESLNLAWDDGYPSGGNYWSDYLGVDNYSGPYQDETGSDAIGDMPYEIDEYNNDNYPLMNPYTPQRDVVNTDVVTGKDDCIKIATPTTLIPTISRGYTTEINVTVENRGDFVETFNVTIYANMTTNGNMTLIGTQLVVNLLPDYQTTLTFIWNSSTFAYGNYTIIANTTDKVLVNDLNITVTIPGDFSGDFKVGPYDFALLAAAYGSTPWQPGPVGEWNPNCDVGKPLKKVGPFDFAILAANYGNEYVYP